jgi:hypothetical protein
MLASKNTSIDNKHMSEEAGKQISRWDVIDQILEFTPEACKPCEKPGEIAAKLAGRVAAAELTMEQAQLALRQDIDDHCSMGPAYKGKGSCVGAMLDCGYGGRDFTEIELLAAGFGMTQGMPTDEVN